MDLWLKFIKRKQAHQEYRLNVLSSFIVWISDEVFQYRLDKTLSTSFQLVLQDLLLSSLFRTLRNILFILFSINKSSVLSCGYLRLFFFFKLGVHYYSFLALPSKNIAWRECSKLKHTSVFVKIHNIRELKTSLIS